MRYWTYFEIQEQERLFEDLQSWFLKNNFHRSHQRWNEVNVLKLLIGVPRLGAALRELGVRCTYAVAIVLQENDEPIIHIDYMPGVKARILLPVLNTKGSFTAFYTASSEPVLETNYDGGKNSWQFRPDQVTEVTRFELTKPVILRIDQPHAVITSQPEFPRISLSLRLDKDPVWMLENDTVNSGQIGV